MSKEVTSFWVVVPFYNEQKLLRTCLQALANQDDDDFSIVLVDNKSTDGSHRIAQEFIKQRLDLDIHLITEAQKGTGAAADTGFRYAIQHKAQIIARTDADTMPAPNWVRQMKHYFADKGARIIGGKLKPRKDEEIYRWWDGIMVSGLIRIAEFVPRFWHRGGQYNYPMFMIPGLNMAIDAALYEQVDGFPRTSIDTTDEDLEIHLKVRRVISGDQAYFAKDVIVYGSIRKVKAFGYAGILLWYWERRYKPKLIDVR
jgi:glycosyltransferase involved in cell wall biosynthesis